MTSSPLVLYDLAGADPALRFSPFCWKIRMALAHKGLDVTTLPWRFIEKEAIAASQQERVPVLVDSGEWIADSWRIALHLEKKYADRPSLFGAAQAIPLTRFFNTYADTVLAPAIGRLILLDIVACLDDPNRAYFRATREKFFGRRLEELVADKEAHRTALVQVLAPLNRTLTDQPFFAGEAPAYADYCLFGMFMWARCVSPQELLTDQEQPLHGWRTRLLDRFDGLAGKACRIGA